MPDPEPGPEPGSFPFKRYDSEQLILLLCLGYNSNCVWAMHGYIYGLVVSFTRSCANVVL